MRSTAGATDGKSIDDLVGEPAAIVADLIAAAHRNRMSAEATETHSSAIQLLLR